MSFYKQVRTFFLKNDPSRVHLSKKIALTFKNKSTHQVVLKRLAEVYKSGGPSNIKIIPKVDVTNTRVESAEEE